MSGKEFTPALGYGFLTPVYDLAVGLLTRERRWRSDLVRLIDPQPGDRILDVGCGTGSLLVRLGQLVLQQIDCLVQIVLPSFEAFLCGPVPQPTIFLSR